MRERVTNWIPRHPTAALALATSVLPTTGSVAAAEILASATTVIYAKRTVVPDRTTIGQGPHTRTRTEVEG
jgi:hypothetical protein